MMALRGSVLNIYRRILRVGKTWTAEVEKDTKEERLYIINEARQLFRKNKNLSDAEEIKQCVKEAEARLEIALHYRTPYPRPVNIPHLGLPATMSRGKKTQETLRKRAKPIYLHSQDDS